MPLIQRRGRPPAPLTLEVIRALVPADIARLQVGEGKVVGVPVVQRLRIIHHRIAVAQAQGFDFVDIARMCDITTQRITQLQSDPHYMNLVAYYAEQMTDSSVDAGTRIQEQMIDIAELALEEIHDRVEDPAKRSTIPIGELRQLSAMTLDRTVAPPKAATTAVTAPVNITFNMGSRTLTPPPKSDDSKLIDHDDLTEAKP